MIYNIQLLRAFAAALVLCRHLDPILANAGIDPRLLDFGNVGVDLFFVISGFVMVHTVALRPVSAPTFFWNRIKRVAPLYWILTAAVTLLALAAPGLMKSTEVSWPGFIKSILFVPYTRSDGLDQPILFLGWTLNYEMFFYAVFAFALWLSASAIRKTVLITSVVLLALVIAGLWVEPKPGLAYFYLYPITLEFAYGMLIGLTQTTWARLGGARGAILLVAGSAVMIALPFIVGLGPRYLLAGLPAAVVLIGELALEYAGLRPANPLVT